MTASLPGLGGDQWPALAVLAAAGAALVAAALSRSRRYPRGTAVTPALPRPRRGGTTLWGRPWASPLSDGRDRFGFASSRQLRKEASLAAARRRAAHTRPSLARRSRALAPSEVGYPLGRSHPGGVALWPSWEASLRLVAPPGEGKTFRALAPVLRQHPGPALATSTKADLYELTALARARRGPVCAIDPDLLAPAAARARWSPVAGCERSEVAERRAAAFVAAAGSDGDAQHGSFFRDSARDLLKAYLHAAALEGLDIRAVLDWSRRPEETAPAEVLGSSPFAAAGWVDLVGLHTTGAPETTSGVLRYVGRALSCFSHEAVVEQCCPLPGDELDIEQLLRANGTVYLLGKGTRLGAIAPLMTAFADEVFDCAERLAARMPCRRLDPPLLGLLDEAPSIAPVPSLPELLGDGRGRGIVVVYAMQSFSQAVTRWGRQRAETMGNATTITAVLGGLTSSSDLADLERVCGQRRVKRVTTHRGIAGPNGREQSRTFAWESEPVLRADQVRTLPAGTALLLWSRLPPVLARLPLLSELPGWALVREEEAAARDANDRARSPASTLAGPLAARADV
ncbi:MAG: type IV secretory system conjugative DNA transfer family protein [Acidimicrobiales bacterium]